MPKLAESKTCIAELHLVGVHVLNLLQSLETVRKCVSLRMFQLVVKCVPGKRQNNGTDLLIVSFS